MSTKLNFLGRLLLRSGHRRWVQSTYGGWKCRVRPAGASVALVLCGVSAVVGVDSANAVGSGSKKCSAATLVLGKSSAAGTSTTTKQGTACGQGGVRIQYCPTSSAYWSPWKYGADASQLLVARANPGYSVTLSQHTTTAPNSAYASNFPFTL